VRRAGAADLAAVRALEAAAFQDWRRASDASLRRSLTSPHQEVWAIDAPEGRAAGLASFIVLWKFGHRWRVYDVATRPDLQGHGLGRALMQHAEAAAKRAGATWMSLEADPKERGLVPWYKHQGYEVRATLPGFYPNGHAAVRMVKRL